MFLKTGHYNSEKDKNNRERKKAVEKLLGGSVVWSLSGDMSKQSHYYLI